VSGVLPRRDSHRIAAPDHKPPAQLPGLERRAIVVRVVYAELRCRPAATRTA